MKYCLAIIMTFMDSGFIWVAVFCDFCTLSPSQESRQALRDNLLHNCWRLNDASTWTAGTLEFL